MSRTGKRPVVVPKGVTAALTGNAITLKGPKGTLVQDFNSLKRITLTSDAKGIQVIRAEESRDARREQGLVRAIVQNMATGVAEGFTRSLEIVGVGYRAQVKGKAVALSLGFSHPVDFPIPDGISIVIDKQIVTVSGCDRALVGQTAARIRKLRLPEPYKGKGIKYTDEVLRRKAGKQVASAGAKGG